MSKTVLHAARDSELSRRSPSHSDAIAAPLLHTNWTTFDVRESGPSSCDCNHLITWSAGPRATLATCKATQKSARRTVARDATTHLPSLRL
eukprot:4648046-Alexandrium_andersonii.AAC.1